MYKSSNLQPVKRPREIIKMENNSKEYFFLCPECFTVYHADVGYSIFYDEYIDRSKEGLVMRPGYFCEKCGDYAFQVDERIINSVKRLLQIGVNTKSSCSGHPEKFSDCAFTYEDGLLGLDNDECTYGACISMSPPDTNEDIFNKVFEEMKCIYEYSSKAIFIEPNEQSRLHFIICPVTDVKDFRKAGLIRRTMMIDKANQNMDDITKEFVNKFIRDVKCKYRNSGEINGNN